MPAGSGVFMTPSIPPGITIPGIMILTGTHPDGPSECHSVIPIWASAWDTGGPIILPGIILVTMVTLLFMIPGTILIGAMVHTGAGTIMDTITGIITATMVMDCITPITGLYTTDPVVLLRTTASLLPTMPHQSTAVV